MKRLVIHQGSKQQIINVQEGENLLEVLRSHGLTITAVCGGNGRCKKCTVRANNVSLLSCQTKIHEDMEIELPEEPLVPPPSIRYSEGPYDIALDLGTTTLAFYLIDGTTKGIVHSISTTNPQMSYGADVISRILAASYGHLDAMHQVTIEAINKMIRHLLPHNPLKRLVVSGNTVMLHLLLCEDPTSMGKSPYQARFLEAKEFPGAALGLLGEKILLLPAISSFIGADIVAGCMKVDLLNEPQTTLLIDLGTNGELVLKANHTYYATSTAVGPAFEGATIEKGMGGIPGAIAQVTYNDELVFQTIAGKPQGICGSGLLDMVAILLQEGILDESGHFNSNDNSKLSPRLHEQQFTLTNEVYITQKDIREFQLAKSAIRSGISVLLEKAQLSPSDISKVYLAGGFGFFMNPSSAITVGLFPPEWRDRLTIIGNSSGLGSVMIANNPALIKACQRLAEQVMVVDLNQTPSFNDYFIKYLSFSQNQEELQ